MSPEEIRAAAIDRIARHLFDQDDGNLWWGHPELQVGESKPYLDRAAAIVDALGDMLPTGEVWGVAGPGWAWLTEYRTQQEASDEAERWDGGRVQHAWTCEPTDVTE